MIKKTAGKVFVFLTLFVAFRAAAEEVTFPEGTATPSETCGACHQAIYREYAFGIGSDLRIPETASEKPGQGAKDRPNVSSTATAHAAAAASLHALDFSGKKEYCNGCHFPEPFAIPGPNAAEPAKHKAKQAADQLKGLTCASCHLTPEGKIRGVHAVKAPHATVVEPALQTSVMCSFCHGSGKRVIGKQNQTFLEWRDDFLGAGLGKDQCQDCHMPRTVRKVAEDSDLEPRVVARHLWTGGHSRQRHMNALSLTITQPVAGKAGVAFDLTNIGAGHSVPTGFGRAIFLEADVADKAGKVVASKEWMFAPNVGDRPDDKKYLEEDKKLANPGSQLKADAQGPHEFPIRAGEGRLLTWQPQLKAGVYQVKARLIYTLDRYGKRNDPKNETEVNSAVLNLSKAAD